MKKKNDTKLTKGQEIWRRFRKNKPAVIGLIILCIFIFVAIFANLLVPYEKATVQHIADRLQPPSSEHWFGTDKLGRDEFARVLYGCRYSLLIGVTATLIAVIIGLVLASLAAYYGGIVDSIIMRVMDIFTSVPALIMAITIVAALGTSTVNMFIALVVISVPGFVRTQRSALLNIVGQEYIEAARACGTGLFRVLTKHVLTNAIGTIIVGATMSVATQILTAATLSFLGLGFQPPTPEWGAMLSEARYEMRDAFYLLLFPGLSIVLSTMSINLVGDGLRDALDPKLKN